MLDQRKLQTIIAEGETQQAEFKQQLVLDNSYSKSEFVKDIIALANSANTVAYLIIGVADDGNIVGTTLTDVARLQQILDVYVQPALSLLTYQVSFKNESSLTVQIIEVRPKLKPYRVAKATERLGLHEVYVRHGSIVVRASPEEIVEMQDESSGGRERRRLQKKAENLVRLGKLEEALVAYTQIIEIYPSADILLARGVIQQRLLDELINTTSYAGREIQLRDGALQDFADALALSESEEFECAVRLARFRTQPFFDREEDRSWLQERLSGPEAGEFLYLQLVVIEDRTYMLNDAQQALSVINMVDTAIKLGFNPPALRFFRAMAHYRMKNFGLALADIEDAIAEWQPSKRVAWDLGINVYKSLKALILSYMGDYEGAWKLRNALDGPAWFVDEANDLDLEILCRYAMAWQHGTIEEEGEQLAEKVIQVLEPVLPKLYTLYPTIAKAITQWQVISWLKK